MVLPTDDHGDMCPCSFCEGDRLHEKDKEIALLRERIAELEDVEKLLRKNLGLYIADCKKYLARIAEMEALLTAVDNEHIRQLLMDAAYEEDDEVVDAVFKALERLRPDAGGEG